MVSTVSSAATSTSVQSTSAKASTTLTSDFETFLKMLTAQAQYQDPLNPLDSAEYASQLAQFSSVEQSVRTNELLEELIGSQSQSGLSSMANWIGKTVLVPSSGTFSGNALTFETATDDGASSAEFVVYDTSGKELYREKIDPNAENFTWDGTGSSGQIMSNATYQFNIERYLGETLLSDDVAVSYEDVVEVRLSEGEALFILEGGARVSLSDVSAVR